MKPLKPEDFREVAIVGIPLLTIVGFTEDIFTKQGVDDWVWYFVALSLVMFVNKRFLPLILAPIFTVLTLTGFYLSAPGAEGNLALLNCLLGIVVLWIMAVIIFCRHKLESAWRRSEMQYRALFKNMHIGFAHCRMIYKGDKPVDFIYLSVNPAFGQITGLGGVVGKRVTEVIPGIKDLHPELFETYGRVASTGKPKKFEYFLKTAKVWLSVSAYCPAKGHFVTTFEDITERKRAENSESLFRSLIDRSSDAINVVEPETGRFCDVNETTCHRLGYTRQELLSMRVSDMDEDVTQSEWPRIVEDVRQRRSLVREGRLRRKDGTTFPVEVSIRWVELEREYIVAVVRDITERKRAEESMRTSQEQLRLLVEQAPISIAMFDREMRYMITSRRWVSENGRGCKNLVGLSHYQHLPDLPERWKEAHRKGLAGEFVKNDEDLWAQADGSKIWLRWAVHPWRDVKDEIGGIIISTEDITEWKKAEAEVRVSEDRLRMVTENARIGLVMVNREHRYTFANGAYFDILNLPSTDIVGQRLADVLAPLYEEQIRPRLDRAFAGERVSYELHKPLPGEDHFFAVKYEPMKADGIVSRVVVVITDITEQKRASAEIQKQLDELQRWHGAMIGREERILGLKQEINELLTRQNRPRRYSEINTP